MDSINNSSHVDTTSTNSSKQHKMPSGGTQQDNNRDDENIWKPTVDKAGNGFAVIRFLPSDIRCPMGTILGPRIQRSNWQVVHREVSDLHRSSRTLWVNSTARLWNTGNEEDRETVRKQKRRLHYVTNVLVDLRPIRILRTKVKVFKYQFGKKIFDKIQDMMQPQFPGETPVDPFDLWNGADFQLKIRNYEGYRNYDRSEFKSPSSLFDGDEVQLQATLNQLHDISEYVDPATYKSYDELQTKLIEVLGQTAPRTIKEEVATDSEVPWDEPKSAPATAEAAGDDGDEDAMSFFQKLANAD